jgi:hypothetical protein
LPSFFVQERFQPGKKHGLLGGFLHLFRKGWSWQLGGSTTTSCVFLTFMLDQTS